MLITEHYLDLILLENNPEIFMENYLGEISLDPVIALKNKLAELMKDFWKYVKDGRSKLKEITTSAKTLARSLKNDINKGLIGKASEKIKNAIVFVIKKSGEDSVKLLKGLIISIFILMVTLFIFSTTPLGGYIVITIILSSMIYDMYKKATKFKNYFKDQKIEDKEIKPVIKSASKKLHVKEESLQKFVVGSKNYSKQTLDQSFVAALEELKRNNKSKTFMISLVKGTYEATKKINSKRKEK